MTKTLCMNKRLWLVMVTLALVLASLALSQDPAAAQDAAAMKQYGEATSSPSASASPDKPGTETNTTAPPSDAQNEGGGGEAFDPAQEAPRPSAPANSQGGEDHSANTEPPSGSNGGQVPSAKTPSAGDPDAGSYFKPIVPSILPDVFPKGQPETGNTNAPSVPQPEVEGLRSGFDELQGALESLRAAVMSVFPFAAEQPAQPGTETNTTAPATATQNTPMQQEPAPDNAPGSSGGGEIPSGNPEPPSDPNGGQVSSDTTKVTDCDRQAVMLDDRAAEVLRLHNEIRTDHGLEPFCVQQNLMTAAQGHAEDMLRRGYYTHETLEGVEHQERIKSAGYKCSCTTAENIHDIHGVEPGSDEVGKAFWGDGKGIKGWMQSPDHLKNILNPDLREIGIGLKNGQSPERSGTTTKFVVDFASGQ